MDVRMVRFPGKNGEKCLNTSRGPMVLTANVWVRWACSSCEGDFSGYRIPGMQKARRRWLAGDGKSDLACVAEEAIVASSWGVIRVRGGSELLI